jgi:hypothetical protein
MNNAIALESSSCSTEVAGGKEINNSAWQVSDEGCYRWTKVCNCGIAKPSV